MWQARLAELRAQPIGSKGLSDHELLRSLVEVKYGPSTPQLRDEGVSK
jgi:hypothetical protein